MHKPIAAISAGSVRVLKHSARKHIIRGLLCAAGGIMCLSSHASVYTPSGLPNAVEQQMAKISPARIKADVDFLADDLLEGRGTGTRGGDIAARYIATQFALAGLKPLGDNGSYLQNVRFTGVTTDGAKTTAAFVSGGQSTALKFADDYVLNDQTAQATEDLDAPIVYVGFGIEAPEYNWNDYKNVDVRGKVVLLFVNEPESQDPKFFNGPALTYYGRWVYKYEEAARKGAIGALIIHRTDLASYGWNVVNTSWTGEEVSLADDTDPKLKAAAWIQLDRAKALLAGANLDIDAMYRAANQRDFKPIELPVHFKAHVQSTVRSFASSNVVGLLPGRDLVENPATAPTQVVMYTAHYDHLGLLPADPSDPNKDLILNGAVDNGTGCGILLELMRTYSSGSVRPPHSILFASVTAEEKGLLGSRYLGKHLPVPAKDIALDLNYDAILPVGDPTALNLTGYERTTAAPTVEKLVKSFGMTIEPDAHPGAGHYYRSDHFSMARVGVPAFSIGQGSSFKGHPKEWGVAQEDDYVKNRYHQVTDQLGPDADYTGNMRVAQFGYALGWLISNQPQSVGWQRGDEFERARLGKAGH